MQSIDNVRELAPTTSDSLQRAGNINILYSVLQRYICIPDILLAPATSDCPTCHILGTTLTDV